MPQIEPDPELRVIESALGALIPRASGLDRDRLMFQAGAISKTVAARRRWAWPAVAAALAMALTAESLFLGTRPAPRVVERIVYVPVPAIGSFANAPASASPAGVSAELESGVRQSLAAREPVSAGSWAIGSDYQRLQEMVIRFGLDAFPDRPSVVSRSDGGDLSPAPSVTPAGALRSLELERILKPGDPS
jgi:hypothetical protein